MNPITRKKSNKMLVDMLQQCTERQKSSFVKIYGREHPNAPLAQIVESMPDEYLEITIPQVERMISK